MDFEGEPRDGVVKNHDADGDLYVVLFNGGGVTTLTSAQLGAVCEDMLGMSDS